MEAILLCLRKLQYPLFRIPQAAHQFFPGMAWALRWGVAKRVDRSGLLLLVFFRLGLFPPTNRTLDCVAPGGEGSGRGRA